MVNNTCTNDCPLCCNRQYDVENIPVVTVEELKSIDTICLTGGQPMYYWEGFRALCICLERSYPNIKNIYVYMNGAELLNPYNRPYSIGCMMRFPYGSSINYGLTMSPKCEKDWYALEMVSKHIDLWKSNRIYCFSDSDEVKAKKIFPSGDVEIIRREWQEEFKPAPNTFFRRLPIWTV